MQAANLALCAASVALLGLFVPGAPAASESCSVATNNTQKKLLACVTLDGVRRHQDEFQVIADSNGGTRATGTPGYEASVAYVAQTLVAAGFDVELDPFEFTFVPPASLSQTAPIAAQYQTGAFTGSGAGGVAGPVIPVDLALGTSSWPADPSTSTSGCEASDFAGLDFSGPQDIALIQRGACSFAEKAVNAEAAGAEAVVLFNQGDSPARMDLSVGNATTLPDGTPTNLSVLVVGASFPAGVALSELGSAASVDVDPPLVTTQYNVLAELPGHSDGSVVMVGAHLDSVLGSPGVQDNGSGSAAILEVARQMRKVKPHNTLRFAWWGAEESDLVGSTSYVDSLSAEEIEDIALYLNFDKIGSPNHVFFIYDGDDSDGIGAGPGPDGSGEIEKFFEQFYTQLGVPFKGTDFDGRSDYGPFLAVGIPSGGLFTGSEGIKSAEEAATWGGTAGEQYDPCYHLACDTFDNVNLMALEINSDAVAAATLQFGMNTEALNGARGKGNFKPVPQVPNQ
jgi:Zn-dependent M28 family amino/carboxypeptidase